MSNEFWAGYLSGAASIIVGNPLDLIKVRLQAASARSTLSVGPTASSVKTLASGLPAPVLTYGVLNALLFTTYNHALAFLPQRTPTSDDDLDADIQYPLYSHFCAGAIAGFATFVISAPTEYIKCRAQTEQPERASHPIEAHKSKSSFSIAAETFKHHGIRGLFLGGVVTSWRDAIGYGFWFATYEGCTERWNATLTHSPTARGSQRTQDATRVLLCGGLAGVATWISIFPLDVIKTRVQTEATAFGAEKESSTKSIPRSPGSQSRRRGALSITRDTYRHEGLRAFWRGVGVCCLRAFIVNGVQWNVYEWARGSLGDRSVVQHQRAALAAETTEGDTDGQGTEEGVRGRAERGALFMSRDE
ncbi:MAG: hypothetical protein Q9159_000998 [Coniocarpon cinnabarinum]